jgi:hypothetical protein
MSKALAIADTIAARIDAAGLNGRAVIVWKQKDIAGEVRARVERGTGSALMLFYEGFEQVAAHRAPYPAVTRRYLLRVLSRPVLQANQPTADALLEGAALALHQWEPDETATGISEISVTQGTLVEDDAFLIYDLTINVTSKL